jgi:hypothetical protein
MMSPQACTRMTTVQVSHMRRRIHACHMKRRIHACAGMTTVQVIETSGVAIPSISVSMRACVLEYVYACMYVSVHVCILSVSVCDTRVRVCIYQNIDGRACQRLRRRRRGVPEHFYHHQTRGYQDRRLPKKKNVMYESKRHIEVRV